MAERRIVIILTGDEKVLDRAKELAMGYMTDGGGDDGIYTSFEDYPALEDVQVEIRDVGKNDEQV